MNEKELNTLDFFMFWESTTMDFRCWLLKFIKLYVDWWILNITFIAYITKIKKFDSVVFSNGHEKDMPRESSYP